MTHLVAEPRFDEVLDEAMARKLEDARTLLIQNPLVRPALYRILKDCEPKPYVLAPLEEHISNMPEYANIAHPPYFLIQWLLGVEALEMFELDENGQEISAQQKEGLTEDEIDDLVVDFSFKTTLIGLAVLDEFDPANRLVALLAEVPERYDTYVELLEFLTVKHSYQEIDELLCDRPILMLGRAENDRPILTSVFVDKLAAVGSIIYDDGWQISEEGKEYIERYKERAYGKYHQTELLLVEKRRKE